MHLHERQQRNLRYHELHYRCGPAGAPVRRHRCQLVGRLQRGDWDGELASRTCHGTAVAAWLSGRRAPENSRLLIMSRSIAGIAPQPVQRAVGGKCSDGKNHLDLQHDKGISRSCRSRALASKRVRRPSSTATRPCGAIPLCGVRSLTTRTAASGMPEHWRPRRP